MKYKRSSEMKGNKKIKRGIKRGEEVKR